MLTCESIQTPNSFLFDLILRSPYGDYSTTANKLHPEFRLRRSEIPSHVKQCGFDATSFLPASCEWRGRHFTRHCCDLAKYCSFASTRFFTSECCNFDSPASPDSNSANCINLSKCYYERWLPDERRYSANFMNSVANFELPN